MSIPTIITPMNFTLVRDAICQLLANERDNQKELAIKSGAEESWVYQTIDFTIYPKRFRFPDVCEMPCVFAYFNQIDFPENEQDIYENYAFGNLRVDYYAVGKTEYEGKGKKARIIRTADENAEDRLNYLSAQIYKTLCSEAANVYNGTDNLVTSWKIKKWERVLLPEGNNTAETVLGGSFQFEAGFDEPTYYAQTREIKEFYTKLNIRDEYIDPFVRRIFGRAKPG